MSDIASIDGSLVVCENSCSSIRTSLLALQKTNRLKEITSKNIEVYERISSSFKIENEQELSVLEILTEYYMHRKFGQTRANDDGWICHREDYRKKTADLPAELCVLLGLDLVSQISFKVQGAESDYAKMSLGLRTDSGTGLALVNPTMPRIVDLFNALLEERKDARRFFAVPCERARHPFYLLTIEEAHALSDALSLTKESFSRSVHPPAIDCERFITWPLKAEKKYPRSLDSEKDKAAAMPRRKVRKKN